MKYTLSKREKQWLRRRMNLHIGRIFAIQTDNRRERERNATQDKQAVLAR